MGESAKAAARELEQKKREIFVRNLSYDTTSDELIELFQEIGPIKRGSVTQKEGVSRGFGFIKFALEEDASTAIAEMNGRDFKGRNLIIETAVNKGQNPLLGAAEDGTALKSKKAVKNAVETTGPKLTDLGDQKERKLQLVVFGVSASIGKKSFRKYLKTLSKKASVQVITSDHPLAGWIDGVAFDYPAPGEAGDATASAADYKALLVTAVNGMDYKKIMDAINAPGANGILHRKLLEYAKQGGDETGSDDEEEAPTTTVAATTAAAAAQSKAAAVYSARSVNIITEARLRKRKCRLILRNLSFQATETNIATKLMTFGPLTEVAIARVPVDASEAQNKRRRFKNNSNGGEEEVAQTPRLKSRGFAFVTFLCENDARKAVEESSSIKICNREFALDFCTSKDKHATPEDAAAAAEAAVAATTAATNAAADAEDISVSGSDGDSDSDGDGDSDSDGDDGDDSDKDSDDNDTDSDAGDSDSEADSDASSAGSGEEEEAPAPAPAPAPVPVPVKAADVKEGKTIFVR
jgi:RNA recognition motif-containing protein